MKCKFIYQFKSGGASDSLNQTYDVQSIPKIGEKIVFVGENDEHSSNKVLDVIHQINTISSSHEITIYYGDAD